jgi:hypothetical protein
VQRETSNLEFSEEAVHLDKCMSRASVGSQSGLRADLMKQAHSYVPNVV